MIKPFLGVAIASLLATLSHADVEIHHGYLRASAPGAPNSAGFLVMYNNGDTDNALVAASTPAAKVTELHNHEHDQGVMRMRRVERIAVAAGAHQVLEPGGYHIMLMGLQSPLVDGDSVEMTLEFEDGSQQTLGLPVMRSAPAHHHGDHQGHHQQHQEHHQSGHGNHGAHHGKGKSND